MSPAKLKLLAYRKRWWPLLVFLALPWFWAAFLIPWWVTVVGMVMMPVAVIMIIVVAFPAPPGARRAGDDAEVSNTQIDKMREASFGLNNLLGRWSSVSRDTRASLEEVQQHVEDVIEHTETSVIEITNRFLAITRKTRTQMEYALGLLQQTKHSEHEAEKGDVDLSLPQYIRASEAMLNSLTSHLLHFSESSLELARRQERVREQSRRIDELLDQMTGMASQVGLLALNTSVIVQGSGQRDFVDLTDKVRGLSQAANDLSRDVRQSLGGIKNEITEAYAAITNMAQEARNTARQAQAEVGQLSDGMLSKNREVSDMLARINALGAEIQQDINQIIMAMQFQDITQQKLERLKNPVLSQTLTALHSLSEETRFLNSRLNTRLVDASAMDNGPAAAAPFRVVRNGAVTTVDMTEEEQASPAPELSQQQSATPRKPGESDTKVELF
jgi:methyl-accepting chemotaxis protein